MVKDNSESKRGNLVSQLHGLHSGQQQVFFLHTHMIVQTTAFVTPVD